MIEHVFRRGQAENIKAYLNLLDHHELIDLFYSIDEEDYEKLVRQVDNRSLVKMLPLMRKNIAKTVIDLLGEGRLGEVFNGLKTDDAARLLRMFSPRKKQKLLTEIDKSEQISKILSYPKDSAGAMMQTEVCTLLQGASISEAVESVRFQKKTLEKVVNIYVVDDQNRLLGFVQLDDLILKKFNESVSEIVKPVKCCHPEEDREEVGLICSKYDLDRIPVVDDSGKLLGQITHDDIQDVIEEEASEDILAFAGIKPGTDSGKIRSALGRLPWIVFSLLTSLLTGQILVHFDHQTDRAILLASFVPLIMNATGNAGTQTAMIVTRNVALGSREFGHRLPLPREFAIGQILAFVVGLTAFLIVLLLYGQDIALRVGLTVFISMVAAALFGMVVPLGFGKMGVDPAVASGPLVTSGCDLMSVGFYFLIIVLFKGF